jgi:hypothetical protein
MLRVLVALAAVLAAVAARAGPWTLDEGQGKAFVTSTFTYGDHGFDDDGDLIEVPAYQKFELTAALEYGMRPWLTLIARGALREERANDNVTPTVVAPVSRSFGSVAGGARVRLHRGEGWVASAQGTVMSGGFDSTGSTATSDGPAAELRALAGVSRSVMGRPVYAAVETAYRARFETGDPDEVKVDVTLGARVLPRWLLLARSHSTFETGGDAHYHKVGGSIVYSVRERLRLEAGALATVAGRNAVRELGGRIGFWYEY